MGFLAGAVTVIVLAGVAVMLLYALGIWRSVNDESFLETLRDVAKQWFSGDFWT